MSWSNIPSSAGDTIQHYDWLIQYWRAMRERAQIAVLADVEWPRTAQPYYSGLVTAATSTTITDTAQGDTTPAWPHTWVGYTGHDPLPADYDLVIDVDPDDPRKSIHAQISGESGGPPVNTLIISTIADYIAAGAISSASDLIDKRYTILKRGGLWWDQRWPSPPNDFELVRAASFQFSRGGAVTSSTTNSLTMADQHWTVDAFAGKDLVVHGNDSRLHRVTITSNTADTLTYATQSWTAIGPFSIVATGSYCWPGGTAQYARWYEGRIQQYWSHNPNDGISPATLPKTVETVFGGEACLTESPLYVFDYDAWVDFDDPCSQGMPRDSAWNPYLPRSLRYLQVAAEELCGYFIEHQNYNGAASIPNFVPATWFKKAGIGPSFTRTITAYSGGARQFASLGAANIPTNVYFAVLNDDGNVATSGFTSGLTDTSLPGGTADEVGKTIVIAFGWTREFPRTFRYLYPKTIFVPELNDDEPIPSLQDPPTASFPGQWRSRPASTACTERRDYDFSTHTGAPGRLDDIGDSIAEGMIARYVGDNHADPFTDTEVDGPQPDILTYEDRFFAGVGPNHLIWGDSGTATDGSTLSFTDTAKNWTGGTLRTETGTATGGSTTTLADTSKAGNGFWNATTGRWVGFTLRITSGANTGQKRPIINMTGTMLTVTPAFPNAIIAGVGYAIDEPGNYELNRWQGRTITLTKPDGTQFAATVAANDADTIWFTAAIGEAVAAGWTYSIADPTPGTVWLRSGGEWIKPPTPDYPDDQHVVLPDKVTRYGRLMVGDYLAPCLPELYAGLHELTWIKKGIDFVSRHDPDTPENNQAFGYSSGGYDPLTAGSFAAMMSSIAADVNGQFASATETQGAVTPHKSATDAILGSISTDGAGEVAASYGDCITYAAEACYGYGRLTGINTSFACQVDAFAFSGFGGLTTATGPRVVTNSGIGDPDNGGEAIYDTTQFVPAGDAVAFRQFHQFSSFPAGTDAARITDEALGSLSAIDLHPDQPHLIAPSLPNTSNSMTSTDAFGWTTLDAVAVLKFDGGMSYP